MIYWNLDYPATWVMVVLLPLKIWASWESARRDQLGWFVLFFLTWLYAIPEIVYLVWFRKRDLY